MKTLNSISAYQHVERAISRIIGGFIGVLLALMVIIVFSNVIARYFLNSALAWSEEISRFMLIWLAFLGAVLAYIRGEHLGLDVLVKILPRKAAGIVMIVANILVLIAVITLLYGGVHLTKNTLASGWVSPAAGVPYGFVYSIVPISMAVILIFSIIKLFDSVVFITAPNREAD